MKRALFRGVLMIACVGALTACGDPKSASDSNFTKAINEVLKAENPLCYIVSTQTFPLVLRKDGQYSYGASLTQMNALVKAGVLQSKETQTNKSYEGLGGAENSLVPAIEFSLTPTGKTAYKEKLPASEKWPQGGSGFCLGTAEVADIVEYSEPELQQGGTVSLVKYTYEVKSAESWANAEDVKKAFPDFAKADSDGIAAEIRLERGVKGWRKSRY